MIGLLVWRRLGAQWRVLAALGFTLVLTITAAATTAISVSGSAEDSLRSTVAGVAASERFVDVAVTGALVEDTRTLDTAFRAEFAGRLTTVDQEVWGRVVTESYGLPSAGRRAVDSLTVLGEYDDLIDHARLERGSWPVRGTGSVIEVAVPADAADRLRLEIGDSLRLTNRLDSSRISVQVVGTFAPADRGDVYWSGESLAVRGFEDAGSYPTYGPLMTAPGALADLPVAESRFRVVPDLRELDPASLPLLRTEIFELVGNDGTLQIGSSEGGPTDASVETGLDDVLASVAAPVAVARTAVLLPGVMMALLAASTLLLLGRLLADFRRDGTELFLARVLSWRQVFSGSLIESAALAVPAVAAAPWLGIAVLQTQASLGTDRAGPAGPGISTWLVVGAIGVAATGLLATASWTRGERRSTGVRGRAAVVVAWTGLEAGLVALAAFAALQLWRYRGESLRDRAGEFGVDPVMVLAPTLVLLAGVMLTVRLLDVAFGALERPARRLRGLGGALAGWHLARRHAARRALLVLLLLASAVGAFCASYVTSWTDSQRDQVDQAIGADVRISGLDELDAAAAAVGDVPGVRQVSPVVRTPTRVVDRPLELLAVDPLELGGVLRPEPARLGWRELVERLATTGSDEALPALVSPDLAETAGDEGRLLLDIHGRDVEIDVVGTLPEIPGVDSREASGALVDRASLRALVPDLDDALTASRELWVATDRGAVDNMRAVAGDAAGSPSVRDRWSEVDAELDGAVGSALVAALTIALAAALAFAMIGVMAGTSVELRRRRPELAALRAIGLGSRSLGRSLMLERVLLVTVTTCGGLVVGAAAGWLMVPWLVLTDQATSPVPEVQVGVPWLLLSGFLAAVALMSMLLVAPMVRSASRLVVADQLRLGEDT